MDNQHVSKIVKIFDKLLIEHANEVYEYHEVFQERFQKARFSGGYRFPLRPVFFHKDELLLIEQNTRQILRLIFSLSNRIFQNNIKQIATFLHNKHLFETWVKGFRIPTSFSLARPDGFFWDNQQFIIEQNIGSGLGGLGILDILNEFFDTHPVIRKLRKRFKINTFSCSNTLAGFLSKERCKNMTIGYLDAIDVKTGKIYDEEGFILVERLQKKGVNILYTIPSELKINRYNVTFKGRKIDILFRNFPSEEIWERFGELKDLLQACIKGKILMFENPLELIPSNKLFLALLSDTRYDKFFSTEERDLIRKCIPWTRVFEDIKTDYHGQSIDLVSRVAKNADLFVLKKGDSWTGLHVKMGSVCSRSEWHDTIQEALQAGNWIVQQRIHCPKVRIPFFVNNSIIFEGVIQMASPYMIGDKLGTILCRNSSPGGSPVLAFAGGKNQTTGMTIGFGIG